MKFKYGAISSWVNVSTMTSKPIVEENLGTTPVCIVSGDKRFFGYSNGCVLPAFRQEAISMLKFISLHPRFILGSSSRENVAEGPIGYRVPLYGESWISERVIETTTTSDVTTTGYTREDGCFIYDTSLNMCSYYDVLGSRIDSSYLTANDGPPNTGDDHTDPGDAVGLSDVALGAMPYDYLALIMRAFSISNLDFENPISFRSKFNFGSSFVFRIQPKVINISERFPSKENPSKDSLNDSPTIKVQGDKTPRKQKPKQNTIPPPKPE